MVFTAWLRGFEISSSHSLFSVIWVIEVRSDSTLSSSVLGFSISWSVILTRRITMVRRYLEPRNIWYRILWNPSKRRITGEAMVDTFLLCTESIIPFARLSEQPQERSGFLQGDPGLLSIHGDPGLPPSHGYPWHSVISDICHNLIFFLYFSWIFNIYLEEIMQTIQSTRDISLVSTSTSLALICFLCTILFLKGTVSVFSGYPQCKVGNV